MSKQNQTTSPAAAPVTTDPNDVQTADIPRRTTSVYLPVTLLDELAEIAAEERRSRTFVIEEAVREWLARRKGRRA